MSFDKKIVLFLTLFIIFIIGLGVTMVLKTSELVEHDYYEKDLNFQASITAKQNAINLGINPKIIYKEKEKMIELGFSTNKNKLVGKIFFQKPNNQSIDFSIPLGIDENNKQIVPIQNISKGVWYIWVEGQAEKTSFKTESIKIKL